MVTIRERSTYLFNGVHYKMIAASYVDDDAYCYMQDEFGSGEWLRASYIRENFTEEKKEK